MSLAEFEFTPDERFQPNPADPITVTIKPLDTAGKWDIERSMDENGNPSWKAVAKSMRYVTGWSGGGIGPFSRDAMNKLLEDPTMEWRFFFGNICGHMWLQSRLTESAAKKSSSPSTSA
jgi:hypothetical protein